MIHPLDETALGRFVLWTKQTIDHMPHGQMLPNRCVPTLTVRDEFSQRLDIVNESSSRFAKPNISQRKLTPPFMQYLHLNMDF
jgi:hypothetical protein